VDHDSYFGMKKKLYSSAYFEKNESGKNKPFDATVKFTCSIDGTLRCPHLEMKVIYLMFCFLLGRNVHIHTSSIDSQTHVESPFSLSSFVHFSTPKPRTDARKKINYDSHTYVVYEPQKMSKIKQNRRATLFTGHFAHQRPIV